jgi:ribonuclease BN (tRNA processing enzyme)
MTDHETYARLSPNGPSPSPLDLEVARFAENADLFICEAQYTDEEYEQKKGWGHSTFLDALERASPAKVRRMAIFRHDPAHDDGFLDRILEFCRNTVVDRNYTFSCFLAQEGMALEL